MELGIDGVLQIKNPKHTFTELNAWIDKFAKDNHTTNLKNLESILVSNAMELKKTKHLTQAELDQLFSKLKNVELRNYVQDKGAYVHQDRLQELYQNQGDWDCSRLLLMLKELESSFKSNNYIATIALLRAILDHVAPIFSHNTFNEVVNKYSSKSLSKFFKNLNESSRQIADHYLHMPIRDTEALPNELQVNFARELDMLLMEIIRINKANKKL